MDHRVVLLGLAVLGTLRPMVARVPAPLRSAADLATLDSVEG